MTKKRVRLIDVYEGYIVGNPELDVTGSVQRRSEVPDTKQKQPGGAN